MKQQLEEIVAELAGASGRLRRLAEDLPEERWPRRADPQRWSVAECVVHLNLTSRAFLPLIRTALAGHRDERRPPQPRRYRRTFVGWLLWRLLGSGSRFARTRTSAPFEPRVEQPRAEVLADFAGLQEELVACVRSADGLPLDRIRVASAFDPRVRYDLYSCFSILARHQHRHLSQAERVWAES